MRKLFLLIFVITVSLAASAAVVTPERAMQVAQSFVPVQKIPKKNAKGAAAAPRSEIVYTHYMPKSGRPAIYVVNIGNAFAIVSADDVAHPVLGYNYSKSWPTDGKIPPQVKFFLDNLAAQMEAASKYPQDTETASEWQNPKQRKAARLSLTNNLPDSVGPLLTTTWDQGQYYNAMCPVEEQSEEDGHCPTGCLATAMAQIIKYWGDKQPIFTRGMHSYVSDYGILTANYDTTTYDFANMPNELTSQSTPEQVNAVAQLMSDCGVAVNMGYGVQSSGAIEVNARGAMINFFHFSADAGYADRDYYTDEQWDNMLRENIAAGKPVLYCGYGDVGGHAFICHGYKQGGYFSFNFGWSGWYDGWYLSNAVTPVEGYEFNSDQSAIFGLKPDNNKGNVLLCQTGGNSMFHVDEPMELYHVFGTNNYQHYNYSNECYNTFTLISTDADNQLVTDILAFDNQNVTIYDGLGETNLLRSLEGGSENDMTPVVSSADTITLVYAGKLNKAGFTLLISPNSSCRVVSNFLTSVDTTTIHLQWTENGSSTQWEVEYGLKGFALGEGTRQTVSANTIDITNLQTFTEYDIYVRPVCGQEQYGFWNKVSVMSEAPFWHEVVTHQPAGYTTDEAGNVTISTAEGMAWLISVANGLNGEQSHTFAGKKVSVTHDLDIGQFRWTPIDNFQGSFDADEHIIANLKVFDTINDYQGLFGFSQNSDFRNITLINAQASGPHYVGGLVGKAENATIFNCNINGAISAKERAGGLVGYAALCTLNNCYSLGMVHVETADAGGLVGACSASDIMNCYSQADVSSYSFTAGGLVGVNYTSNIINCYTNGYVKGNIYTGGLTSLFDARDAELFGRDAKMLNCYAGDRVSGAGYSLQEGPLDGAIIGSTNATPYIYNCYGLADFSSHPLIGVTHPDFASLGSPVIADTTSIDFSVDPLHLLDEVMVNGISYSDLLSALNAWVNTNNEDGKYRHWAADTEKINSGYPIFAPNENPPTGIDNTKTNGNAKATKILRNGQIFILRGDKVYTIDGREVR